MPNFLDKVFTPRMGALLTSYSNNPETSRAGSLQLAQIDQAEQAELESKNKVEETVRSMGAKLLEQAINNGADADTRDKLAIMAGLDVKSAGISLGGIPGNKDPDEKFNAILGSLAQGGKYTPESLEAFQQTRSYGALVPIAGKGEKALVLKPQDVAIDPVTGKQIGENTNVRSMARNGPGWREQVYQRALAAQDKIASEVGQSTRLSDRMRLAQAKIDVKTASGLGGVGEAGKLRAGLTARKESLIKYDNAAETALKILDEDPGAITIKGDVAKNVVSMYANIKGLYDLMPWAEVENLDLEESHYNDELNKVAGDNAAVRTTMFNLAIQLAVADGLVGNAKMTNEQLRRAIANIGAEGRSPLAMKRKINEVRERVAQSLDIAIDGAIEDYSDIDRPDPTKPASAAEASDDDLFK